MVEIPNGHLDPQSIVTEAIPTWIQTNQSQNIDARPPMSHTPLTILMPLGWDCVSVYLFAQLLGNQMIISSAWIRVVFSHMVVKLLCKILWQVLQSCGKHVTNDSYVNGVNNVQVLEMGIKWCNHHGFFPCQAELLSGHMNMYIYIILHNFSTLR